MSNQFTPGPWEAGIGNRLSDGDDVWVVDSSEGSIAEMMCPADVEEANARLIAAAPALYESLKAVARNIDNDGVRCWCGKWRDHEASCVAATAALALVDQSTEAK